ncbi:MAG: AAA family ATPase [Candidatus Pacebacteria bacterium]|nr:AAA family ATPase [Candidatus Paceibacterota bacterium]
MRLHAFRIKTFRSIVNTGFQELSPDGISLIVGQNESGKSSVLEGINAFETGEVFEDDIRSNSSMPEVTCIFKFTNIAEIIECVPDGKELPEGFEKVFTQIDNCVALTRTWSTDNYEEGKLVLENPELRSVWQIPEKVAEPTKEIVSDQSESSKLVTITEAEFVKEIFNNLPIIDIFEDNSLLPPTIDLDDLVKKNTKADGYEGAKNFLLIAEIKPEELQNPSSVRIIEDMLEQKNKKVNTELQKYWHQTVGKKDKIEVVLELKNHTITKEGKQGHPYLTFWIRDKNGKLSPVQRSKGVKWFISFYLKLEATAKSGSGRVFLIDEPGANLHAKAQKDILSVFEKQKDNLQIIFTTHSPYLLDVEKVYRVHAVERADTEDDKSETRVIPFHKLGSASTDTLMPLYTSMGVDASHQSVISLENNVLLEEISAFFYMKAFWKLFGKTEIIHFLPATGCANLPLLANLMLGWGLSFAVVLDDDSHGRRVFKELKESRVCDEDKLIKIESCAGIEDLFTKSDFATHILGDSKIKIQDTNSEYMKDQQVSKVITARDFLIAVRDEKIKADDFSETTKDSIGELLSKIVATL